MIDNIFVEEKFNKILESVGNAVKKPTPRGNDDQRQLPLSGDDIGKIVDEMVEPLTVADFLLEFLIEHHAHNQCQHQCDRIVNSHKRKHIDH